MNKTIRRLRKESRKLKKQLKDVRKKIVTTTARQAKAYATIFLSALIFCLCSNSSAVQPMPGGVRIQWDSITGDVSYAVWRLPPGTTNWVWIANITNSVYVYTNSIPDGTMFGVSAIHRMTNGVCCVASDIGVAAWPPAVNTPPLTVRLTPTNGYTVATGRWVRVSSDLATFDDWLRFRHAGTNVMVEHRTSPLRPRLFMQYPASVPPPPFP